MKSEIEATLRNKYASLGLGDQMIGAVAEMVAATVPAGGDVAGAVASAETFLRALQSDRDRIRAKAQRDAQQAPATATATPTADQPRKEAAGVDEIGKLLQAVNTLSQRFDALESERKSGRRREQLSQVVSKLPEHLRAPYQRTPLTGTDDEFAATLETVTKEAEGILAKIAPQGVATGRPNAARADQGKEASKEEIAEIVKSFRV